MKPSIDDRDGVNIIRSRIGLERECVMINDEDDPYEMIETAKEIDPELRKVLIDECQFLNEWQVDRIAKAVDDFEIDVLCYGLRTDFLTNSFPGSKRLFEIADTIEEIKSHCECGRKAMMNARFDSNGYLILDGDQVMIGGNDLYRPLCRKCYNEAAEKSLRKRIEEFKEENNIKQNETSN